MTHRTYLSFALLASATAHAVILFAFMPGASLIIPGIQEEALHVSLITPRTPAPGLPTPTARESTLSDSSPSTRNEIQQVSAESTWATVSTVSRGSTLDTSGQDPDSAATTASKLETLVREALAAHFHYPPLARQNGWHGEVRLGLHIEPNGELSRIHLLGSSGYGILDRAAIHSLMAVIRIPSAAVLLNGSSYDLVLPVRYQLLDS